MLLVVEPLCVQIVCRLVRTRFHQVAHGLRRRHASRDWPRPRAPSPPRPLALRARRRLTISAIVPLLRALIRRSRGKPCDVIVVMLARGEQRAFEVQDRAAIEDVDGGELLAQQIRAWIRAGSRSRPRSPRSCRSPSASPCPSPGSARSPQARARRHRRTASAHIRRGRCRRAAGRSASSGGSPSDRGRSRPIR